MGIYGGMVSISRWVVSIDELDVVKGDLGFV